MDDEARALVDGATSGKLVWPEPGPRATRVDLAWRKGFDDGWTAAMRRVRQVALGEEPEADYDEWR